MRQFRITKRFVRTDSEVFSPQELEYQGNSRSIKLWRAISEDGFAIDFTESIIDRIIENNANWLEKIKPTRWRAKKYGVYDALKVSGGDIAYETMIDTESIADSLAYLAGNYFRTKEQAESAAQKVKELLLSLHEEGDNTDKNDMVTKSNSLPVSNLSGQRDE